MQHWHFERFGETAVKRVVCTLLNQVAYKGKSAGEQYK